MPIFKYKPKVNSEDFKENCLPVTRRQQFFDLLSIRLGTIFEIGLVLLLFSLPLIAAVIFRDSMEINVNSVYKDSNDLEMIIKQVDFLFYVILIPCLCILSIGVAGIIKIFRRMLWAEPIFFWNDFKSGVKDNVLHYLILFFIFSLLLLGKGALEMYLYQSKAIITIPFGIVVCIFLPWFFTFVYLDSIYKNSFIKSLKFSFGLAIRIYPFLILFSICFGTFAFLKIIPLIFVKYLIIIALVIFVLPIFILMLFEFEISKMDLLINKEENKTIYLKGLYNHRKE